MYFYALYSWAAKYYSYYYSIYSYYFGGSSNSSSNGTVSVRNFPTDFTVVEETPTVLDLAPLNLRYTGRGRDELTITLSVDDGTLEAESARGVEVSGSGTNTITLTGTRSELDRFFNREDVTFTGSENASGDNVATLTLTDETSGNSTVLGTSDLSITDTPDTFDGTSGDDNLTGTNGVDTINGYAGDDLIEGGQSGDTMDGGDGTDWLYYTTSSAGVNVDLSGTTQTASGGDAEGDVISNFENVRGSNFDDVLIGDEGENHLIGLAGTDVLRGNGGDDVIRGGAGADTLEGGAGTDALEYSSSGQGVNVNLNLDGSGNHIVSGGDAEGDIANGFEDVFGSDHDDVIIGDAGDNYLLGRLGDDTIDGGDGNDHIRGGAGADTLEGGAGTDLLSYLDATAGIAIDLETGMGSAGDAAGDVVSGFENVYGSNFGDVITGDGERNIIFGYDGDDTLNGGAGNDTIRGGLGDDTMDGGDGIDYVNYRDATSGITIDLNADVNGFQSVTGGGVGNDTISNFENVDGTNFDDRFIGDENANIFIGRGGADTFVFNGALGNGNVDRIVDFASGTDLIELDSAVFDGLNLGTLDPSALTINATGDAEGAGAQITYEADTGYLRYDADGEGGDDAIIFGRLRANLTIDENDFLIV